MTPEQLAAILRENPDLAQANAHATIARPRPATVTKADGGMWGKVQRFFVPGPLPGLNEMIAAAKIGGKGRAYSNMKKQATGEVQEAIWRQGIKPMGRVMVTCTWQEPNRRRDPSNVYAGIKFIEDGLVAAGILQNDGWRHIAGNRHELILDKDRPGVWVEIQEAQP